MRILVTGGTGQLGKHLQQMLPWPEAVFVGSRDYDLTDQLSVREMFQHHEPTVVIHLAARVGGIQDNIASPIEYLEDNLLMNTNVVKAAYDYGVKKFIGILSTCIYPDKVSAYPMDENELHNGPPAPTNLGYGYAKRMLGIYLETIRKTTGLEYYSIIPCNLYSEQDNFEDGKKAHFVTALLKKIKTAATNGDAGINLLGTGLPIRQFMHAEDLAKIITSCVGRTISTDFNVAPDKSLSIREIALLALKATGNLHLQVTFDQDPNKDGQFRKDASNKVLRDLFPQFEFTEFEAGLRRSYNNIK
jgi:GDP-L-fucose synthase